MVMLFKDRPVLRRELSAAAGHTVRGGVTTFEVQRDRDEIGGYPVKGGVRIFRGALVCTDSHGWLMPAQLGVGLTARGYALDSGVARYNGEFSINTRRGVILVENSTGVDRIASGDLGATCYMVDDQTVAKTNGGGTRSAAGIVRDIDAKGVWVQF